MALTQDTIPNFIGGVSQQPDKLMFSNQAKELINMLPDPTVGLCKRKPTEHVARLMDSLKIQPQVYTVNKEDEKYQVFLTGSTVRVFDLEGNEKTVNFLVKEEATEEEKEAERAKLLEYITTTNPIKDLQMDNIGDYTFILNKTVTAQLSNETYPNPYPNAAMVFVKQGDYAIDYSIKLNDKTVTYTTDKDDRTTLKTNMIAKNLYDKLVTDIGTTDWTFSRVNSTILIQNKNGADFTISTEDSNADRSMFCVYKEFDAVSNLPAVAFNGFIVKIVGDDGDDSDDYYVQFTTKDGSNNGSGTWQECPSTDIKYHVLGETMPHAIIREADGTFTYKAIEWTDRRAGDEDSAKTPSIFGQKITEVFTHKGRLAFLAGDKSIYSDVDDIFSLFKRTVMTSLDTDPIDVGSNSKMVLLKHTLPYDGNLLLFSPSSIFTIKGGDVFSNSTVTLDLTMEYPCSSLCKPISAGTSGVFVFENGNYSGLYEIYTNSSYVTSARNITEQVPCYLPSNIFKMAGNTINSIICLLSQNEPTSIYVYNYYYTSDSKAQSAWHKWTLDNAQRVLNVDFIDNWLYLTIQYEDGIYLEKLNCTQKQIDEGLDFLVHLDRKFKVTATYDEATKTSSFELPYETNADLLNIVNVNNGFLLGFTKTDKTITIKGKCKDLIVGTPYNSYWKFGTIYKKQATQSGGSRTIEGILMLKDLELSYADAGYFDVQVEPMYIAQDSSHYTCTCTNLGTYSAILGKVSIESGLFLIPVLAKNDEVIISITNDSYLPSTFNSITWLGELITRGK
jgi:hypothetical protein